MDPSAPQTVLKGVAITSSLCGAAAGLYGGYKHGAPGKFLLHSAVNSGIVAATFFSIREYVVSPIMVSTLPGRQYRLRKQKSFQSVGDPRFEEPTSLSWTDIRTSHLLDSGISGGLAGGILNTVKRGRHGLAPGLTTSALLCTLFQWCFNEFNICRIRYASANLGGPAAQRTIHDPFEPKQRLSPQLSTSTTSIEPAASRSPIDRILSMFGQPVSDDKYLERLKGEREFYLRRIAELEKKQ